MRSLPVMLLMLAGALLPGSAFASDRMDIIAVIQAYNDAGNRGDRAGYAAACAPDAVVIDHVPPYRFEGPTACADEYDAVVAWGTARRVDLNGLVQTVGKPVLLDVSGDRAYAVFPVQDRFKMNGKLNVERLYLTATLRRSGGRWVIEGLVYTSLGWRAVVPRAR